VNGFPVPFTPDPERFRGHAAVTAVPRDGGGHITLRFKSKLAPETEGGHWRRAPFELASHVFVDAGKGTDKVAAYDVFARRWRIDPDADPEREAAAAAVARWLASDAEDPRYRFARAVACRLCGAELTKPESQERGIGPDCFELTDGYRRRDGSRHQRRMDAEAMHARVRARWEEAEARRLEEERQAREERQERARQRAASLAETRERQERLRERMRDVRPAPSARYASHEDWCEAMGYQPEVVPT
jgi:hypothetical protein